MQVGPDAAAAAARRGSPGSASDRSLGGAVSTSGLVKSYGSVRALAGVDLVAAPGTVLGLLGPNGAGKTTTIRILTTLLKPDAGTAKVDALHVLPDPAHLPDRIGLPAHYPPL